MSGPYRLDLAYPAIWLAIEYDGRDHLTPERALRDLDRQADLTAAGWTKVLRFRAAQVHRPEVVVAGVRRELLRYARLHDLTLAEVLALIDPNGTWPPHHERPCAGRIDQRVVIGPRGTGALWGEHPRSARIDQPQ